MHDARWPIGQVDHLTAVTDAFNDPSVGDITLATLNHDLVLERALRETDTSYSDGFGRKHGTLHVWNDDFKPRGRKLLKLHGSIDWWLYRFDLDGFNGQFTARPNHGNAERPRGPNDEDLGYTLMGRPLILTGTFNKILKYGSGIFADQHFRFHEALKAADALVVIGYGFRDKAINERIIAWAERPGNRRMVVVHDHPEKFGLSARGAIRGKWTAWQRRDLLAFVQERLTPETTWESISAQLR